MKLTPVGKKVYSVSLTPKASSENNKKHKKDKQDVNANLKLENQLFLNNSDPKLFRVRYNVSLVVEGSIDIELVYDFDFGSDVEVDQSFASSLYARSHIPNLTFPYIKSYLEHFLMMSGYGYIPFPLVDFINHPIPENQEK